MKINKSGFLFYTPNFFLFSFFSFFSFFFFLLLLFSSSCTFKRKYSSGGYDYAPNVITPEIEELKVKFKSKVSREVEKEVCGKEPEEAIAEILAQEKFDYLLILSRIKEGNCVKIKALGLEIVGE